MEDVESPLEAMPGKGASNLVDEESTSASPVPPLEEVVNLLPVHVQDLFMRSTVKLNKEQSVELAQFLNKFVDIFAQDDTDLGCFSAIQHRIDTGNSKPICQCMHQKPVGFAEEEEKHLKKILDCGVIQPSNSEQSSPSVLVWKKDGDICWCIGFCAVNNVTKKDAYPLPLIEECLDALSGTEYMSTLDMQFGYWQMEVHPEDCHKTAFLTKQGLFEFTCMSFRLCNAPATFQRVVQLVFHGMTWNEILTYLDDLNVIGTGFQNHLQSLQKSFEHLCQYNLKLKPHMCCLFQTEVPFLWRLVCIKGIAVVQAVLAWLVPQNRKDVESFLGFINYH